MCVLCNCVNEVNVNWADLHKTAECYTRNKCASVWLCHCDSRLDIDLPLRDTCPPTSCQSPCRVRLSWTTSCTWPAPTYSTYCSSIQIFTRSSKNSTPVLWCNSGAYENCLNCALHNAYIIIIILYFTHQHKAAGEKTKQNVKQRLQRLLIRCSLCWGRRPHSPAAELWTGVETERLFLWCPGWWLWCVCQSRGLAQ